jgi:hypothetical protein
MPLLFPGNYVFVLFYVRRVAQSVGYIVSCYGMDERAIGVRSPAEAKGIFLQPLCPDRLWSPPSLLYNGYRGLFIRGNATGA